MLFSNIFPCVSCDGIRGNRPDRPQRTGGAKKEGKGQTEYQFFYIDGGSHKNSSAAVIWGI
jgi:hypothetical protein